jgi:hypothetical protein
LEFSSEHCVGWFAGDSVTKRTRISGLLVVFERIVDCGWIRVLVLASAGVMHVCIVELVRIGNSDPALCENRKDHSYKSVDLLVSGAAFRWCSCCGVICREANDFGEAHISVCESDKQAPSRALGAHRFGGDAASVLHRTAHLFGGEAVCARLSGRSCAATQARGRTVGEVETARRQRP